MNRTDDYLSAEHAAELEDRADELAERDRLLGLERADRVDDTDLRAEDAATLEKRAAEWCDIKDRSDHPSDYGWRSVWDGVL